MKTTTVRNGTKKTAGAKQAKAVQVNAIKNLLKETGMAPAEIRQAVKRQGGQFRKWLESSRELSQTIPIDLTIAMYADEWVNLARSARDRKWTLERMAAEILQDNLMNDEWEKSKAATEQRIAELARKGVR